MPSFRNAKKQAKHIIKNNLAFGQAKHKNKTANKVFSVGTARSYQAALTKVANWLKTNKLESIDNLKSETAVKYLHARSRLIGQKLLDQERQAIQMCLTRKIPVIKSELPKKLQSRAYTPEQVLLIAQAQTTRNSLATKIAYAAGLRAHELLTIRQVNEQVKSKHRTWNKNRFCGRNGVLYTVVGKGGLIREINLPTKLAEQLENSRLTTPQKIIDRQIIYYQYYNISGGKKWTNSFSAASKRLFGWSQGAHGLRHSYAQQRMEELQQTGLSYQNALEIVSQELGHFRPAITEVYLR